MNGSSNSSSIQFHNINTQLTDRLLAIYSLLLILIGTPSNLLCCVIYLQKSNRSNSIKNIFGYLAFLDTVVLYTFNLNYVFREFNAYIKVASSSNDDPINHTNSINNSLNFDSGTGIDSIVIKRNLEEYSLIICRLLSYLAFSTLQTSSWVLAFGSVNRYLLIKKLSKFQFVCKRRYTISICFCITFFFFFQNLHIIRMNGYRSPSGSIVCYKHARYSDYMLWVQRLHLLLYSVLPSIVLLIFNSLLMHTIFESKRRLDNHRRLVIFAATATTALPVNRRKSLFSSPQLRSRTTLTAATTTTTVVAAAAAVRRSCSNTPSRLLHRHSRKLTISLILITISYFTLTFPSTVIFSFFRSYINPPALRRTISLLFTNLSTTTHAIRFFIYFFCSIDFRNDFYKLFLCKRLYHVPPSKSPTQQYATTMNSSSRHLDTFMLQKKSNSN